MIANSIATVSIAGTLRTKLAAIAAAGFDGVEIFDADLISSFMSPSETRHLCEDLGLTIELFQPFRDLEGKTPGRFAQDIDRVKARLDVAEALGTSRILACSNVQVDAIEDDGLAAEQLAQIGDLARERGLVVAYEALAWGHQVSTYQHAWSIVEATDHPAIGLCLDSFHILARESDLSDLSHIPADKILFCQLADAHRLQMDALSWSRHHRLFPGQGDFDLADFTSRLLAVGYSGPLSIEVFNDVFRQTEPYRTAADALRSLRLLQSEVAVDAWLNRGVELPNDVKAIARNRNSEELDFVEIAVGDSDVIDTWLGALGFVHHGAHRRKSVELWTHGSSRFVIKRSGERGEPHISGIGIAVLDMQAMKAKADLLLAPSLERETLDDEQPLLAFRAPNGVELFFSQDPPGLDPDWVREFGAATTNPGNGHGLIDIDHVSLAQDWESFDESVLFFRALAGLAPDPTVEVSSPHGLIRSVAMRSHAQTLCVVLNVPPTAQRAGRVNAPGHVALRVDDIRKSVESLQRSGVTMLEIPDNYYDDLQSRVSLDGEELATLRRLDILYEEDGTGAFLQAYTQVSGDLFLELVQRVGGYRGFGAANSAVRRAAQSRSGDAHSAVAE